MKLSDLGERKILAQVIGDYCSVEDDCSSEMLAGLCLLATTDPVPVPAAQVIVGRSDPYYWGWLSVIINMSDLASSCGRPLMFLNALEMKGTSTEVELQRVLEGMRDACAQEGVRLAGGNLKESDSMSINGVAIGWAHPGEVLTRVGARDGDRIVIIGNPGTFWRDVSRFRSDGTIDEHSPVLRPRTQGAAMRALAGKGILRCAMDNSDGVLPSLREIGRIASCDAFIDLQMLAAHGADPGELAGWFGWGDWTVIAAADPREMEKLFAVSMEHGFGVRDIGNFASGRGEVHLRSGSRCVEAPRLESERFAKDSWFTSGIEGYIKQLENLSVLFSQLIEVRP